MRFPFHSRRELTAAPFTAPPNSLRIQRSALAGAIREGARGRYWAGALRSWLILGKKEHEPIPDSQVFTSSLCNCSFEAGAVEQNRRASDVRTRDCRAPPGVFPTVVSLSVEWGLAEV